MTGRWLTVVLFGLTAAGVGMGVGCAPTRPRPDLTGTDGSYNPDGGTQQGPDGSLYLPDGQTAWPDGAGPLPDGSVPDPDGSTGPQPGDLVQFGTWPEQHNSSDSGWGPVLTDIVRHLPLSYGNTYYDPDRITHGHETSHGIHAHLRNYHNNTGQPANAFYVLEDRWALVIEPGIWKHDVAPYVPFSLRGFRYDLYITGQTAWDDTPLYVWDEWVAYANGGAVGVNLVNLGMWNQGWRDGVAGIVEFTVFAIALAMAVEVLDPVYFQNNLQFREFLAWHARRAMEIFREGAAMSQFAWNEQDNYYNGIRNNADAADIRDFVRRVFGDQWAFEVLELPLP